MAYWIWNASFSVGIAVIDEQHKRLIDYINELNTSLCYHDKYRVKEVLEGLIDYTKSHFSFEESLMNQADYAHFEAHRQTHEAFIKRIDFFKERYENGEDISKQLMDELQIWWTHHIQSEDKAYQKIVTEMLAKKEIVAASESTAQSKWLQALKTKFFK